jgi:hypothetical protein
VAPSARRAVIVGLVLVVVALGPPSALSTSTALASPLSFGLGHPGSSHPPIERPNGPASTGYWYTQEGASLAEENGSSATGQLTSLVEDVTLVTSSYPIGYELNGLSTSGDWYQVLVTYNWGGCNSGFEMTYEVWDNVGGSQSPVCDPTLILSVGDVVQLSLSFPSSIKACLDATDVTTGNVEDDCQSQPDTGAKGFELLDSASNGNGYFTGPMTEIANPNPTSCPDYTNMPVVDYRWPAAFDVNEYYPFSDEFEYGGSGTYCYSGSPSAVSIAAGDPTSHSVDTASGTSYGPHYVSGQNLSYLIPADGWRLVTDPVPVTGATISPRTGTFTLGTVLELNATVSGGTAPYTALWSVNGTFEAPLGLHYNWTATTPGNQTIDAYGVDTRDLVYGPASSILDVPGVLTAGPVGASTSSDGADVGETVTISSRVAGGLPPYQFLWSGLPTGCTPADVPALTCVPTSVGTFDVALDVTDNNGTEVVAPALLMTVSAAFSAATSASRLSVDVGQPFWDNVTTTGGAGPIAFDWSGTPPGCSVPTGAVATCDPVDPGLAEFVVSVEDHNGVQVNLTPPPVTVHSDPLVRLTADRTAADANVLITLQAAVTGGAAPFQYVWGGFPVTCSLTADSPLQSCPFPVGPSEVWLNVTDSNGMVVEAAPVTLGIYPALTGSLNGGGTVALGSPLVLNATASGGNGPLSYTWLNLPNGCSPPTSGDLNCVPTTAGEYNVTLVLTDTGGGRLTLLSVVNVTAPSTSSPPPSGPIDLVVIGGLVAAFVVLLIVAAVATSRRRRGR